MLALVLSLLCLAAPGESSPPHDPERRIAEVTMRIQRRPDDAALYLERGRLQASVGHSRAALADFGTVLRLEPRNADALVATAFVQRRLGETVEALGSVRRAMELGAAGPSTVRLRARLLVDLGRPAEAGPLFAQALAATARPEPEQFLELASALATADADVDVALAVLEGGLATLGPVVGLVDAAVALDMQRGCAERALRRLELLRPRMARLAPLHERRARVLEAAGRVLEAAGERREAQLAGDRDPEAVATAPANGSTMPPLAAPSAPATPPTPAVTLVPANAVWRYRDTGVSPAASWTSPTFNDSSWATGAAELGYGDGDEATVVASGPANAHRPTTWFRHSFTIPDPTIFATARVRLLVDDGAVVYVNGVEIARWNLVNGPVSSGLWASTAIGGAEEDTFRLFAFPVSLLVAGSNTVAVEVHQSSPSSSDISFALELIAGDGPVSIVRGPYLQDMTPSSVCVHWRTDQPAASQVWAGDSPTTLQPVFLDATLRTEHRAIVTGLPAETLRHYRVGDATGILPGQATTQTWTTLPPAGAVRPLRMWVLGDSGFGSTNQLIVRELYATFAAAHPADAMLMLGDNAYYVGSDAEYQVGVFDVYGRFMASTCCWSTLGNHDAASANTAAQSGTYYDVFDLPAGGQAGGLPSGTEAYYSFDRGHVHFVCLDSMDSDRTATGAMMTWLTADLASTSARWTVAFFHHPPYSEGSHPSDDPQDSGGRMRDMREVALPILEAGGVDLVLSGHCHSYERSFLLDGHYDTSSTLQPSMVLDSGNGDPLGDGAYAKAGTGPAPHQGAVYVVAGSAGSTSGGQLGHPAMCVSLDRLGSLVLDFDGDRLDATFVGLAGVEDRFTLLKGEVRTLFRDQPRISLSAGGRQDWQLKAGPAQAGRLYLVAGAYGTEPGVLFGGVHVPLNVDPWLQLSLAFANSAYYPNSLGALDAAGSATAAFVLPPLTDPTLVGTEVHHAYVVFDGPGLSMASNTVKVTLLP